MVTGAGKGARGVMTDLQVLGVFLVLLVSVVITAAGKDEYGE